MMGEDGSLRAVGSCWLGFQILSSGRMEVFAIAVVASIIFSGGSKDTFVSVMMLSWHSRLHVDWFWVVACGDSIGSTLRLKGMQSFEIFVSRFKGSLSMGVVAV